jgi:thiol-disulfide isomerase/thioredoxin
MKLYVRNCFVIAILILTGFSSCEFIDNSKKIAISGRIINPTGNSVFIEQLQYYNVDTLAITQIDENGKFQIEFELDEASEIRLNDGKESTSFYVKPGAKLNIEIDTKEFDESIVFDGDLQEENNFIVSRYLKFYDFENTPPPNYYSISQNLTAKAYLNYVDSVFKYQEDFIKKSFNSLNLDSLFCKFLLQKVKLDKINYKQYGFYGANGTDTSELSESVRKDLAEKMINTKKTILIDNNDAKLFVNYSLSNAVLFLVKNKYQDLDRLQIDSIFYLELSEIYTDAELSFYIYNSHIEYLNQNNKDVYEAKQGLINKYVTDSIFKTNLERKYQLILGKLEQEYAEGLNKVNMGADEMQDKTFSDILEPYLGKVIYLDIWASWCGPCKTELPFSKELKERLKGEDIAFVYLSTDRDEAAWENMLVIMQLEGEHYRANKKIIDYLRSEFDLQYIPHYILFDKAGNLVKNNAPRPSSEEIESELRALL